MRAGFNNHFRNLLEAKKHKMKEKDDDDAAQIYQ